MTDEQGRPLDGKKEWANYSLHFSWSSLRYCSNLWLKQRKQGRLEQTAGPASVYNVAGQLIQAQSSQLHQVTVA